MANVAYDPDDEGGAFALVHKDCTWAYDERDYQRGGHKGMDEMDQWLVYLEGNVGFTEQVRRKARGTVRAMASVGLAFGKVR
jgi:hypothetical protein